MDKVYLLTLGGFTGIFEKQKTAKAAAKNLAVEIGQTFKAKIMELPVNKGGKMVRQAHHPERSRRIVTLIAKTMVRQAHHPE